MSYVSEALLSYHPLLFYHVVANENKQTVLVTTTGVEVM